MIGALDSGSRNLTVIGAGMAGLLFAVRAQELGYEVTVLEKSARAGGLIETTESPSGISESAAHSLLASPAVREWARILDVSLLPVREPARYIVRDGRLRRYPLRFSETLGLLRKLFSKATPEGGDMESWARAHLGEPALEHLLRPFLIGVFGAEPSEISQRLAFPGLTVRKNQSLFSALHARPKNPRAPMVAPKSGMQDFVRALQARLGKSLRLGVEVRELPEGNVAICTDASAAATLLEEREPELAQYLRSVRYAPLVSVTVWARTEDFSKPVRGIGMLSSPKEKRPLLGVLFNSSAFPGRTLEPGICSFTAMLGGTSDPGALQLTDAEIESRICAEFAALLGWRGKVLHLKIHRWPRAVPVYSEDLRTALEYARERLSCRKGLLLFGNYTGAVSVRGMMETTRALTRDGA